MRNDDPLGLRTCSVCDGEHFNVQTYCPAPPATKGHYMSRGTELFLWSILSVIICIGGFGLAYWLHDGLTITAAENAINATNKKDLQTSEPLGAFIFGYAIVGAVVLGLQAAVITMMADCRRKKGKKGK